MHGLELALLTGLVTQGIVGYKKEESDNLLKVT